MLQRIKNIKNEKYLWVFLYLPLYVIWFFILSDRDVSYNLVEAAIDTQIPFIPAFIIPYVLWYLYIPTVLLYMFFHSKQEFIRVATFLFVGMTIGLVAYSIYPTMIDFRPTIAQLEADGGFFNWVIRMIYSVDPGTNVCPSIHCFNSIGLWMAVHESSIIPKKRLVSIASGVLSFFICLSTVFIKQHSVIDIVFACFMAMILYLIIYLPVSLKRALERTVLIKNVEHLGK